MGSSNGFADIVVVVVVIIVGSEIKVVVVEVAEMAQSLGTREPIASELAGRPSQSNVTTSWELRWPREEEDVVAGKSVEPLRE